MVRILTRLCISFEFVVGFGYEYRERSEQGRCRE